MSRKKKQKCKKCKGYFDRDDMKSITIEIYSSDKGCENITEYYCPRDEPIYDRIKRNRNFYGNLYYKELEVHPDGTPKGYIKLKDRIIQDIEDNEVECKYRYEERDLFAFIAVGFILGVASMGILFVLLS